MILKAAGAPEAVYQSFSENARPQRPPWLKADLVLLSSGDTDLACIKTNIPWIMRNSGDYRRQAYRHHKVLFEQVGIVRAGNGYIRLERAGLTSEAPASPFRPQ